MATWSGWEIQFFNRAHILNTPPNQRLLTAWANHATSPNCANNPIDLSIAVGGSSHCHANTGIHHWTMRYGSHGDAASAFDTEIHQAWAHALLSALNSGNPFQVANWNDVVSVFVSWGSVSMSNWYFNQFQTSGGGGGGGGGKGARAHHGWTDLRHSINHNMPKALRASEQHTSAALRALSKARKVRL